MKADFDLLRGAAATFGHTHPRISCSSVRRTIHRLDSANSVCNCRVLGQPPVTRLHMPELALDHPERVFHIGPLQLIQDRAHRRTLVQHLALARSHRYVPVDLDVLRFIALADTLIARVGKDIGFFSMHQRVRLRHVLDVGRTSYGCTSSTASRWRHRSEASIGDPCSS